MGRSTGGLVATLWAPSRRVGGLIPELGVAGDAVDGVPGAGRWPPSSGASRRTQQWEVPTGGAGHYGRSLAGRASSDLPIPEGSRLRIDRLSGGPSPTSGSAVPGAYSWPERSWRGTGTVEKACAECPVLSMGVHVCIFRRAWCERAFTSDTVLDPVVIAQRPRPVRPGDDRAFPGKHIQS